MYGDRLSPMRYLSGILVLIDEKCYRPPTPRQPNKMVALRRSTMSNTPANSSHRDETGQAETGRTDVARLSGALSARAALRLKHLVQSLPGMQEVEALARQKFRSEVPLLEEIPSYLLDLGGKRMRPLLTFMTARAAGVATPTQELIDVATGIELIHMATLLHDDIIDHSPLRRHQPSPYRKFGLGNTLLAGDFLLTRAFSLCARLDQFIIDATEQACIELVEGEISESSLGERAHTVESSLTIARKKTASLFRLAAASAAHLARCPAEAVRDFAAFGESLGVAFQVLDDVLDVTSEEDLLGKRSGTDLRERKPSIVNVLWLQSGSELARHLLTPPNAVATEQEEQFVDQALAELREGPVIERARSIARKVAHEGLDHLERAAQALGNRAVPEAFDDLTLLARFTLSRLG